MNRLPYLGIPTGEIPLNQQTAVRTQAHHFLRQLLDTLINKSITLFTLCQALFCATLNNPINVVFMLLFVRYRTVYSLFRGIDLCACASVCVYIHTYIHIYIYIYIYTNKHTHTHTHTHKRVSLITTSDNTLLMQRDNI